VYGLASPHAGQLSSTYQGQTFGCSTIGSTRQASDGVMVGQRQMGHASG